MRVKPKIPGLTTSLAAFLQFLFLPQSLFYDSVRISYSRDSDCTLLLVHDFSYPQMYGYVLLSLVTRCIFTFSVVNE